MEFKGEIVTVFLAVLLVTFNPIVIADDSRTMELKGVAVTGLNRLLGEPLWNFGPLGPAGFNTVEAFQPNGDQPLPLTPDSPGPTLLATGVDPGLLAFLGMNEDDFDPADVNLPLRQVRVNVDFAGETRLSLRSHLEAKQLEASLAVPNNPIDLETWLKASGKGSIRCDDDDNARIQLHLRGLIPFGIYAVDGDYQVFNPETLEPVLLAGIPIGGLPNAIVADEKGRANFHRTINFCPMDLREGEAPLLTITIVYHSDQQVNGNVPVLLEKGFLPGLQGHAHVEFLVTGTDIKTGHGIP